MVDRRIQSPTPRESVAFYGKPAATFLRNRAGKFPATNPVLMNAAVASPWHPELRRFPSIPPIPMHCDSLGVAPEPGHGGSRGETVLAYPTVRAAKSSSRFLVAERQAA